MTIKKYTGKTKDEAIEKAKAELGPQVVILNAKEVTGGGVLGLFKKPEYEVTAAIEEEAVTKRSVAAPEASAHGKTAPEPASVPTPEGRGFDAVVDEPIDLFGTGKKTDVSDLKSAFKEISDVIKNTETVKPDINQTGNVIKSDQIETMGQAESHLINLATTRPDPPKPASEYAALANEELRAHADTLAGSANMSFVKVLYNTLLDHEVEETYINQLLEDMGKILSSGNSIDYLIANIYQKMVLKLGKPNTITLSEENRPRVIFFIGPTGVGKTTTIAKLASKYIVEKGKRVALFTADTYRIAAQEQLKVYADILGVSLTVIYPGDDINSLVAANANADLIMVDTNGFSHKNSEQKKDLDEMLVSLDGRYERDIYLVLSATTKFKDLKDIIDTYRQFTDFSMIFTKLDETLCYGNIYNCRLYSGAGLSYVTNGQNVPDDIEIIDPQKMVRGLLGGH